MKTFKMGGLHPPGNKISAGKPVEYVDLPGKVVIPLNQHIGTPAVAVVSKGDKVKVGTLIGRAEGRISANVHASVSGTVTKVDNFTDGSGYSCQSIFIDVKGDEWEPAISQNNALERECRLSPEEIVARIGNAGIVGMGGATFPTQVKLTPPRDAKAEVLIVNASECEPYLTADHAMMLEKPEHILTGITILMKALNISRAVIGVENNKADAIELLKKYLPQYQGIEILTLRVKYPQGSEKQLIESVTKRRVKSGQLPVSVGAIVVNVSSVFAVYEAVQKNKPLIDRVVAVSGKALPNPSNLYARIGTPIQNLIDRAGGIPENTAKIVNGGPMMGNALSNLEAPVTKGCTGIILLAEKETLRRQEYDCIRCTQCLVVCPMGLDPTLLMDLVKYKMWDEVKSNHVADCIECGCCSYICPSNRPLLDYIRLGKFRR
jgi:electron transport complex protein RnfC